MTPSNESIENAVYRVTEWLDPNSRVPTAHGDMRADYWLQSEVDRFKEKWTEAWVQVNQAAAIALHTWTGTQLPVTGEDPKE